uniref:DUF4485 domain-containing protein n=1 Tax=Timema bartmani TaxID=61472 RepID=A0A7R9I5E7_9NEOP|nr:unnamed protein product [Timema bartmani]
MNDGATNRPDEIYSSTVLLDETPKVVLKRTRGKAASTNVLCTPWELRACAVYRRSECGLHPTTNRAVLQARDVLSHGLPLLQTVVVKPASVFERSKASLSRQTSLQMTVRSGFESRLYLIGSVPAFGWKIILAETTLRTPSRDSNLNIPVIGSLVHCESSALDHEATEAGGDSSNRKWWEQKFYNMADTVERLEDDFRFNLFLIKTMIPYLQSVSGKKESLRGSVGWLVRVGFRRSRTADRERVHRWMSKLRRYSRTEHEMRMRNDFLYYLALNLQNGELRPPFTENPPVGPLHTVLHMLPGGTEALAEDEDKWWLQYDSDQEEEDVESSRSAQPLIYQRSPDGGAFLSAQPVPRCGAFCYLAVVARAQDE